MSAAEARPPAPGEPRPAASAASRIAELMARHPVADSDLNLLLHELGVHQVELELQNEELQRAQSALESSRDRYRDLYEHAPLGYVTMGFDGVVVEANRLAASMFQTVPFRLPGCRMLDFVHLEDRALFLRHQTLLLRREGAQSLELRLVPSATALRWVSMQMNLVGEESTGAGQLRVALTDITERRHMQEGMARLAAVVGSLDEAIVSRDTAGRITTWNDGARRLFGLPAERMVGATMDDLVPAQRRAEEADLLDRLRHGETIAHLDTERLGRDGRLLPISLSLAPIREGRRVIGSAMIARDISERRRGERALRERLRRLEVLSQVGQELILGEAGPDEMRRELVARVHAALGTDISLNYDVDEAAGRLRLLSAEGLSDAEREELASPAIDESPCGLVARRRLPLIVPSVQTSGMPELQRFRAIGVRSYAGYPLVAHGRLYGVAAIVSTSHDMFPAGDLLVMQSACDQMAAMLERARLVGELHASQERLLLADRAKDEFIAILAHELRNPLAPIRYAAEAMRRLRGDDAAQRAWALSIIERQLAQMTHLLEDLLDVSRLTRNRIELRRERIDLTRAVVQAVETTQPLIQAQNHRLQLELPDGPVMVDGDLTRLTQVFANLLNNAVKYSDPGADIAVTMRLDGDSAVRVAVRDTGMGIDAAQIGQVFDMFSQLAPSLERSSGGLGIGLALGRGLVELHGGTMDVQSRGLGQGSEFVVRLPVAPGEVESEPVESGLAWLASGRRTPPVAHYGAAGPWDRRLTPASEPAPEPAPEISAASLPAAEAEPAPESTTESASAPAPAADTSRLLVVDDNADSAEMLAAVLRLSGHEVRTAFGGAEALRIAADWPPDAAVLDIGMPGLNGYEVCRRLRAMAGGRPLRIVACTGWGQLADRERAREAGFDAHVVKPVDPVVLLRLIGAPPAGGDVSGTQPVRTADGGAG